MKWQSVREGCTLGPCLLGALVDEIMDYIREGNAH